MEEKGETTYRRIEKDQRERPLLNLKSPRASSTSSVGVLETKQKIRIGPEANQQWDPTGPGYLSGNQMVTG